MADEATAEVQDATQSQDEAKRERSTIEFPYLDLDDAVSIARGVHAVGGASCQLDQLAAHLEQSVKSSMFRLQLNTARIFGLVAYSQGTVTLTPLGTRICDPQQEQGARVESFLTVPLYRSIHEQFRGVTLPPTSGLEAAMVTLGVALKQKDKARQVFQRAATQSGFFAHGPNRLVSPSIRTSESRPPLGTDEKSTGDDSHKTNGGGGGGGEQHPFIQGLIRTLPTPDGSWPIDKRAQWLQAAVSVFNLIYTDDGTGGRIEVRVEKGIGQ